MKKSAQAGIAAPLVLLLITVGLIVYITVSSSAPFKNRLFSLLYPKPLSKAATTVEGSCITDYPASYNKAFGFIKRASDGTYLGYATYSKKYLNPQTSRYRSLWTLVERTSSDQGLSWSCPKDVAPLPDLNSMIIEGLYDPQLPTKNRFAAIDRLINVTWSPSGTDMEQPSRYFWPVTIYPYPDWQQLHEYPILGFDPANSKMIDLFKQLGLSTNRRWDNLYSPWTLPVADNSDEMNFYFHGWQGEVKNAGSLPTCGSTGRLADADSYIDQYDYCKCDLANNDSTMSYSVCTNDKIFYSTNSNPNNRLEFKVFNGDPRNRSDFSLNGNQWLSETWSAILTTRNVRAICEKPYCDILGHVGDQIVLKLPSGKYIMYFNGQQMIKDSSGQVVNDGMGRSGIYVVTSNDPIHFAASSEGIKPLRKMGGSYWYSPNVVRPTGTSYPDNLLGNIFSSNSRFSAVYEPSLNKIVMLAQITELPAESGLNNKTYRFLIDPANPYYVEKVDEIALSQTPTPTLTPKFVIYFGSTPVSTRQTLESKYNLRWLNHAGLPAGMTLGTARTQGYFNSTYWPAYSVYTGDPNVVSNADLAAYSQPQELIGHPERFVLYWGSTPIADRITLEQKYSMTWINHAGLQPGLTVSAARVKGIIGANYWPGYSVYRGDRNILTNADLAPYAKPQEIR